VEQAAVLERKDQSDTLAQPPRLPENKPAVDQPGTRREVFALDEGDVVITFPDALSAASFADLEAYLEVFIKKMKRRTSTKSQPDAAPDIR
jgi:hypothetical protein